MKRSRHTSEGWYPFGFGDQGVGSGSAWTPAIAGVTG